MGQPQILVPVGDACLPWHSNDGDDLRLLHVEPATSSAEAFPQPGGSAHLDSTTYRSVHFYGSTLEATLREAADYLALLTRRFGRPPHITALHEEYNWEEPDPANAWQLSLVFSDLGSGLTH